MEPVIYADTLFLFNFFMNTIILIITEKLLYRRVPVFRIGLGAALGAVYSLLMFFPQYSFFYTLLLKITVLFGIEYAVFGGKTVKSSVKNFLVFLLVNLCMGGAFLGLIFLTDFGTAVGSVVSGGGIYLNLSPFILIFGILGTYGLLGIYRKMCRRRLYEKSLIKRVKLDYKGRTAELDLFLDTGCRVSDPITDKGAIIAQYNAIKPILSEKEQALIEGQVDAVRAYEIGMRVLPFSTLGGENIIYAILADSVCGEGFLKKKVTVGLIKEKRFEGEYRGIVNPELLLMEENAGQEGILL